MLLQLGPTVETFLRVATKGRTGTIVPALILLLFSGSVWACPQTTVDDRGILRDNYFTLETATKKVQRLYPFAKPVPAVLPSGVRSRRDLVYSRVGRRALTIDVFEPEDSGIGNRPCVLFIHGGAWRSGNKSMEWPLAMHIASRGYVTATVEYRLSPEAKYPAAVRDLKTALRWLREQALVFRIDTTMIAVSGCSSGGHLAALIGSTNGRSDFDEGREYRNHSSEVEAVINIDGDVDLAKSEAIAKDTAKGQLSSEAQWLGGRFSDVPGIWKEASPITYVSSSMPPILFLNSSLEGYHAGRDDMMSRLKELGVRSETVTFAATPHPFWLFHPWFEKTVDTIADFLRRTLAKDAH